MFLAENQMGRFGVLRTTLTALLAGIILFLILSRIYQPLCREGYVKVDCMGGLMKFEKA
jgi:hypothetical protein